MGLIRVPLVEVWKRRQLIRYHRDQVGDDRCFLDDWLVWQFLPDMPPKPPWSHWKTRCEEFYEYRNSDEVDTLPWDAIVDPGKWDLDLFNPIRMHETQIDRELIRINQAIRKHRDIIDRPRTFVDDKELYSVLPEKLPANFRLPPHREFLGEALSPKAGCPAFRRSHEFCDPTLCNPHRWGIH